MKVYLAGPDVFMPDRLRRTEAMRDICRQSGLQAISPLDPLPGKACAAEEDPFDIARRNEDHIRRSDAILANLTPFRGPGADPGTVYEVGFGRALGLPIFGWSTVGQDYASRVRAQAGSGDGQDADGLAIEDFGLFENLMIVCGIESSGGFVLAEDAADRWGDLAVFERCVLRASAILLNRSPAGTAPALARQPARSRRSPP